MEAVTEEQANRAKEAMDELKGLVKDYFGVEGKISYLNAQTSSFRSIKNESGTENRSFVRIRFRHPTSAQLTRAVKADESA